MMKKYLVFLATVCITVFILEVAGFRVISSGRIKDFSPGQQLMTSSVSPKNISDADVKIPAHYRKGFSTPPLPVQKPNMDDVDLNTLEESERNIFNFLKLARGLIKSAHRIESLTIELEQMGLKPQLRRDENEYTGAMTIVRTTNSLRGTRYFHAQYFSDEHSDNDLLQHMSFEMKPSPTAFDQAIRFIRANFATVGKEAAGPDFVAFKTVEGYIVWVKRMNEENLQDDPFNAYSKKDVGTVRIAVEMDAHE